MTSSNKVMFGGIVFLVLAIGSCNAFVVYGTQDEVQVTVNKTERVVQGFGDSQTSKYLVFTDKETFENTDTLFYLKYNSSDVHSKLSDGKTYKLKVYGFRIPFLSMYRNIIGVQQVK